MRLLFISSKDPLKKSNGGELCTNRNYLSFCDILGRDNVTIINLIPKQGSGILNAIRKRLNYLSGYYEGITKETVREVLKLSVNHDYVFIDSSIHGTIAKILRRNNYKGKIVSLFHNVEFSIKLQKAKSQPWKLDEIFVTRYSEEMACKYSDHLVALNERDKTELCKIYGVTNVSVIPISLADRLQVKPEGETLVPPVFIFTGNNWYANIHGLDWFVQNVLDSVDIRLQITGMNMEELREKYKHPKIDFLGFVDDLSAVIGKADYVLLPIFLGSGMKVKTCEALMFGKNIIGTRESFEGYEVDPSLVGALCNTKEEFTNAINMLITTKRPKFNEHSRNYFLSMYSYQATLGKFRELL